MFSILVQQGNVFMKNLNYMHWEMGHMCKGSLTKGYMQYI